MVNDAVLVVIGDCRKFYAVMMDGRTEGGTGVWHHRVPPGLV